MEPKLLKETDEGKKYQANGFKIYYRNAGSVSGNNSENARERIYLITGRASVTVDDSESIQEAPAYIEIPEKTYHKIEALTDIGFILFEEL